MIRKPICWIPVAVSYAVLALFVYFVINPLCYNIFQQPAFVLTADFFCSKIKVPGGLSEYLQTFIDQFTMFRFWGTLFLVAEVFLTAFLTARYVRRITDSNPFVSMLAFILPVAISIVAWTDVKYPFAINMQVMLLAAALNLQQILSKYDWSKFVTPLLAIAIYHACGPVALYTFALCCVVAYALKTDKREFSSVVGAVVVAALWPVLVYKFMLPIKLNAALYDMRPQEQLYVTFDLTIVLYLLFLYIPAMLLLTEFYERAKTVKNKNLLTLISVVVIVISTCLGQNYRDNRPERIGFKFGVAAYNQDWNSIISFVKNNEWLKEYQNYHQMINFYYDMALAAKGQLQDKMFSYPQRLGINALFVDEPLATVVCQPMTVLWNNIGFATNALHYAFESQTTYENSHYAMKDVIDNLLIIGDYNNAQKYLEKYSKVMLSKKYVDDRIKYLYGSHDTEFKSEYVNGIRKNHPRKDFYMGNSQYDVLEIVLANKDNTMASQYLLASTLLQNDLELFLSLILEGYCKVNYNGLPRAYQEAVVLYKSINKNVMPGIEKLHIQSYVIDQFKLFQKDISQNRNNTRYIKEKYANTYWKYYFFDNPKVSGIYFE
ncbi:MAG: hypothetical protein IKO46_04010 [Salinivirgaceae bacterium]|nr:hypothetical protein [Salinivirgaceae bacterium]